MKEDKEQGEIGKKEDSIYLSMAFI